MSENRKVKAYAELERTDGKQIRGCDTWTVPWEDLGREAVLIVESADYDEPVYLKITARLLTVDQFVELCEQGK